MPIDRRGKKLCDRCGELKPAVRPYKKLETCNDCLAATMDYTEDMQDCRKQHYERVRAGRVGSNFEGL